MNNFTVGQHVKINSSEFNVVLEVLSVDNIHIDGTFTGLVLESDHTPNPVNSVYNEYDSYRFSLVEF